MPNQEVTRAEFVQMLVQALDLKAKASNHPFDDVKQGAWYESAILQAYQLGIVYGRDDGTFGVHDNIQRQEMAVMTYRALQAAGIDLKPSDAASELTDAAAIADYAREAVIAMHQAGNLRYAGRKLCSEGNSHPCSSRRHPEPVAESSSS